MEFGPAETQSLKGEQRRRSNPAMYVLTDTSTNQGGVQYIEREGEKKKP